MAKVTFQTVSEMDKATRFPSLDEAALVSQLLGVHNIECIIYSRQRSTKMEDHILMYSDSSFIERIVEGG